jgi:hypothetical protein
LLSDSVCSILWGSAGISQNGRGLRQAEREMRRRAGSKEETEPAQFTELD